MIWCPTCIKWYQPSDMKKKAVFYIPTDLDKEVAITSLPTPGVEDVAITEEIKPKGAFLDMQRKGIHIVSYEERSP